MTSIPGPNPPEYYEELRRPWVPVVPRLIIIAESPPQSGKYFYDLQGKPTESLFSAIMESIVRIPRPAAKEPGLKALMDAGCLLLDATYTPVDGYAKASRKQKILEDVPVLLGRLDKVDPGKKAPILLVKINVCQLLRQPLANRGHTVWNGDVDVDFPGNGNQPKFRAKVAAILDRVKWLPS